MTEEQKIILQQAWKTFGTTAQLDVAIEECAEVIQAITKYMRASSAMEQIERIDHLTEELADLENMIYQIKNGFGIEQAVEVKRTRKIVRLEKTIQKHLENSK